MGRLRRLLRRGGSWRAADEDGGAPVVAPAAAAASEATPRAPAPASARVLLDFLRLLGPGAEAKIGRGLYADPIRGGDAWAYVLRQGHREADESAIRAEMNGRLYRVGSRLQGGGWTRLLLGNDDYTLVASRKQRHELSYLATFCVCLRCLIACERDEQDVPELDELDDLGQFDGDGGERLGAEAVAETAAQPVAEALEGALDQRRETIRYPSGELEAARSRSVRFTLPSIADLRSLSQIVSAHEFELGTVAKISARGGKVAFSALAKQFLDRREYSGPLSMMDIKAVVLNKATQQYKLYKGKTERRFYVRGTLLQFAIDGCSVALTTHKESVLAYESGAVGILYRKQLMSLFIGTIVLEDSFGSFLDTDAAFFLGYGQDTTGAQSIFPGGAVGKPRPLGINELCTHTEFRSGLGFQIKMQ